MGKNISRRHFFQKTATTSIAVGSLAGAQAWALSANSLNWDQTCDVIIIGSGAAGSSAALTAAENGLKALVLEKLPITGGSTTVSNGGTSWAGTDMQEEKGYQDSSELFINDMLKVGGQMNDRQLVETYVNSGLETYGWLKNAGVIFKEISTGAGMSVPRQHLVTPAQLLKTLHIAAKAKGTTFMLEAQAQRLICEEGNKVVGVQVTQRGRTLNIKADKGVILATGGFARSKDLLTRFAPGVVNAKVISGLGCNGDGLKMAWALGADLLDMSYVKATFGFSVSSAAILSSFAFYSGAIIINKDGRRFTNESKSYKLIGDDVLQQKDGVGYQILDAKIHANAAKDSLNNMHRMAEKAGMVQADSIEELAQKLGIDGHALKTTIQTYNDGIDAGQDTFNRTGLTAGSGQLIKLDQAPYYGFESTAVLLSTYCGPKINTKAQVIDIFGNIIPNLFAAGEVTGGVHGAAYLSGTSIGKALVFGRIASKAIADQT